ncbi:LacI family transcriptional regulator [Microbacterium barkeri]|uniref:LacI family transcriptional regulator n=1 Tax=Microbacterium barkeri TaxID=33917 RepID=A0A9W6LWD5_9MICO|nr:LacI family DNA-binding transcriptional regulator [Microbacterium barkeri]MDR6876595.1 DNA-binding LacI/PurR family transcriptional regulator [Microbacterium barkeri]GLJ61060.1 LacI family transcriptional regulator [Microbacterium barkeri]
MATINEVAKLAGVSISTVSYALSGKRTISRSTRERIDQAIAELDYQPHAAARILAGARTQILALSAPLRADGHLPTHMRFTSAVVEAARGRDYDVLLLARDDEVNGIRRVSASSLVDGVVMMGVAEDDERLPIVRAGRIPAALIGISEHAQGVACVDFDFETAARDAIARLADAGHRVVGMIGHPHSFVDRRAGFIGRFDHALEQAAQERGVRLVRQWAGIERGTGAEAVNLILGAAPDVTAIVFHCNEPVVEEALRRLDERGLRVPHDISLLAAAASYDPGRLEHRLSGTTLPIEEMGRIAVEGMLAAVEGVVPGPPRLLPPAFIDRSSIAPPA